MVCEDCQKKLRKLVTPNVNFGSNANRSNIKVNVNMILSKKKDRFDTLSIKCLICKTRVESNNKYCLSCAFSKGLCEMCGSKISETSMNRNTDVDWKDNHRKKKMCERSKVLSTKLLIEKNIIKKEDKCLKQKRNRDESKTITSSKKDKELERNNIDEERKESVSSVFDENLKEEFGNSEDLVDEYEYDEIIKI